MKNSGNISKGVGMLFVKAVERSSRIYAVMSVRGCSGKMAQAEVERMKKEDWLPLGMGITILLLVVLW